MTHILSPAIVLVDDVKSALEITDESGTDQLMVIIDAVSGAVEDYLGRPVVARDVTESIDGDGTTSIFLKPYLVSVTTVTIDDVAVTANTERVFYPKTGEVRLLTKVFTEGSQNIDLVYRHGWELEDVPNQIKRATVLWCCHQYLMTDKDRIGVSSKSTADGSSIVYEPDEVPPTILAMLQRWRIASFG